ncbi:hypothetical protein GRZ55_09615 [Chelativorans sp. ZYF759]|nr:hypothetical protein [Chelativorans sp. ZYF759]
MTILQGLVPIERENISRSACGELMESGFDNAIGMRNAGAMDSRKRESADEILQKQG